MIESLIADLKDRMREVPDFPKRGINFIDITPVLQDSELFTRISDHFAECYAQEDIDAVVAIESRGFIFGAPLAERLGCSFVPIRKPSKLPWKTYSVSYQLEYGEDTIEIHQDALNANDKVVIIDDLLATGGTMAAAIELVQKFDVEILDAVFLVELVFLKGRERLQVSTNSLLQYD